MDLIDVTRDFPSELSCIQYLEKMRWPEGVRCLKCDSDKITKITKKEGVRTRVNKKGDTVESRVPERHIYQCRECRYQFTPTVGTIFNDTHLSLRSWFMATALLCDAKKSVSACQMQRHLGIGSYRTAWYLNHRIRKAMTDGSTEQFTGVVEVDETYVGGKYDPRRKRAKYEKDPVVGIIERGGKVRTFAVDHVTKKNVVGKINEHVSISAEMVCTDESPLYDGLRKHYKHESVNHSNKEYVRGDVHTSHIDGYWSLFKRGIVGSFHKVSIKRLHRYLNEFQYRWNNRESADLFILTIINLLAGITLQYAALTADPAQPSSEEPF